MTSALLFVVIGLLQVGGFGLLALSQARHWQAVRGSSLPRMAALCMRAAGLALIAFSLAVALWRDGPGFGSLLWGTLLTIAALVVTLALSLRRVR
jgi:hypothetical protein